MEKDIIIDIRNVKKRYTLGEIGGRTLQHDLQSWWAGVRGKEDPNSKLGSDKKRGDTFYALDGINLSVYRGETLGIIGSNGAGKSTLLKLLSRVTAPTEGSIDLYGRVTSMLEVGTGFNGELTGRENIYMNGAILGMSKGEIDKKLDAIIDFSEIREFIDTPVKRYSSGMYTKLGFSVAYHLDSEIMIMDEVLAVGDMAFQNKCIQAMRAAAREEGRTILYVSHNMNQIRKLCDRTMVLSEGKIIFLGDTEQAIALYLNQAFREDIRLDYRSYVRPPWLSDTRMRALSSEYVGKEDGIFNAGEPIRFRITWENYEEIRGLSLRLEIRSTSDIRIGTYILYDLEDTVPGETSEAIFEIDPAGLVESTYNVVYCFFVRDDTGNNLNVENVPGLSFTYFPEIPPGSVRWDTREWGFLELKNARLLSLENRKTRKEE